MHDDVPHFVCILHKFSAILVKHSQLSQPKILFCKLMDDGIDFDCCDMESTLVEIIRGDSYAKAANVRQRSRKKVILNFSESWGQEFVHYQAFASI